MKKLIVVIICAVFCGSGDLKAQNSSGQRTARIDIEIGKGKYSVNVTNFVIERGLAKQEWMRKYLSIDESVIKQKGNLYHISFINNSGMKEEHLNLEYKGKINLNGMMHHEYSSIWINKWIQKNYPEVGLFNIETFYVPVPFTFDDYIKKTGQMLFFYSQSISYCPDGDCHTKWRCNQWFFVDAKNGTNSDSKEEEQKISPQEKIFPISSQLLTENDLKGLSKSELRIMRNEIYARHGYIFKSKDLQDYFSKKSWYTPLYNDVSNKLTDIEIKNVDFIKKHEK
jgi:hypothetical protein